MKFSELKLNANVLDALDAMRFDECPFVQLLSNLYLLV